MWSRFATGQGKVGLLKATVSRYARRMTPRRAPFPLSLTGPVGIFDSGVGGLSVWREIARALPGESTVYMADQAHVPYGPRAAPEIRRFCDGITDWLLTQGCKAVVVACNTASAAALRHLRERCPGVPFVGMEPAVKPAAALTRTGVVGIMATPATFQGRLFQATAGRHAADIRLVNQVCDGLAEAVERGDTSGLESEALVRRFVDPMLQAGADVIVLACTHYPFVIDLVRRIAGPHVTVIDPAPAIARQLARVLETAGPVGLPAAGARHRFVTSGNAAAFGAALRTLAGVAAPVESIRWRHVDAQWELGEAATASTTHDRPTATG